MFCLSSRRHQILSRHWTDIESCKTCSDVLNEIIIDHCIGNQAESRVASLKSCVVEQLVRMKI